MYVSMSGRHKLIILAEVGVGEAQIQPWQILQFFSPTPAQDQRQFKVFLIHSLSDTCKNTNTQTPLRDKFITDLKHNYQCPQQSCPQILLSITTKHKHAIQNIAQWKERLSLSPSPTRSWSIKRRSEPSQYCVPMGLQTSTTYTASNWISLAFIHEWQSTETVPFSRNMQYSSKSDYGKCLPQQ